MFIKHRDLDINNVEMNCPSSPSPPPTVSVVFQCSGHRIHMPTQFADFLLDNQHTDQPSNPQPHTPSTPTPKHPTLDPFETLPDDADLFYIHLTHLMLLSNNNMLESVTDAPILAGGDWTN
ncbi:uncharacterized protein F5891DRAFT_1182314 [Suillus fuscotomentosus]|uniref:Uncharacterized protein n=1 Tax=Suillus fuscotomentosus TaxID=1912939 RepID=A0AAD4HRB2_9AGAM|nr:uncharacterized protein F5891DRAFT_1182314 [Suillus fuscotomentosus]KAG1906118.1 hypothetical protein F5891DRAFT_1182314 [Suillus fuscotomentosus]